jgi:hypothetical protein
MYHIRLQLYSTHSHTLTSTWILLTLTGRSLADPLNLFKAPVFYILLSLSPAYVSSFRFFDVTPGLTRFPPDANLPILYQPSSWLGPSIPVAGRPVEGDACPMTPASKHLSCPMVTL